MKQIMLDLDKGTNKELKKIAMEGMRGGSTFR